jgi:hypothetical protein
VPRTRICIPALLATLCLAAGVFAGAAAGQPARNGAESEDRARLASEITTLRDRLSELPADDPSASPVRSELTLLERLDGLLVRQQIMFDKQARLARAEAAMQDKLAAGPENDVSDNPPYPIALLDLLGDAADALETQRAVLDKAERAAKAAVDAAREARTKAESTRRRRLEELDGERDAVGQARASRALRVAELELRIARTRFEIAELDQDAARRDRELHDHNLTITRAVLNFVEQRLDLTPELREELLQGLQQKGLELRRARERAALDLDRAQARRLAAEQRRDRLEQLTPAIVAENEALAAQQETLQVQVGALSQQEERIETVRDLRQRRYRTLAGETGRPEMRDWELELRAFAADLERRHRVEEGRSAQHRDQNQQTRSPSHD